MAVASLFSFDGRPNEPFELRTQLKRPAEWPARVRFHRGMAQSRRPVLLRQRKDRAGGRRGVLSPTLQFAFEKNAYARYPRLAPDIGAAFPAASVVPPAANRDREGAQRRILPQWWTANNADIPAAFMVFLSKSSLYLTDSILCAAYRREGPQGFFPPAPRRAALGSASSHWHSAAAIDVRRAQLAAFCLSPYDRLILKISRSGIRL